MNLVAIKENTKLALATLVAHKLRTFLTILGVFVGVVVIIDVAAALNGFRQSVVEQAESFSTRNVYLHRFPFVRTGRIPSHIFNRKPLALEDAWAIKNEVPFVEHVAPGLTYEVLPPPIAKYKNYEMRNPQLVGGFPEGEIVMNKPLGEGRYITESDNRHRAYVCVLGFNVVEALFPHIDPIGKEILIDGRKFTVIGRNKKYKSGPFGSENPNDNQIVIPYQTFKKIYPRFTDHYIVVRLKEGQLKEGIDHIEQVLRRRRNVRYDRPNDFELETADSFVRTFDDITRAAFGVMLIISSVAFLVGGIGVTNIMLVAVTERTREIGIRKAIGARRRDIIWQFLTEAMTLTGIGGLLGVGVASGVALLIQKLVPRLSMEIPLWAVFFGVTGSVSVGLVFGMWPALRAARLDPIVALRYE